MVSFYLRGLEMADVGTDLKGQYVLALFYLQSIHPLADVLSCHR